LTDLTAKNESVRWHITLIFCGNVDGGAMLQARRSQVRVPMKSMKFFSLPDLASLTMALGFTQPLTEMSTRRYFW
jgi:hypothetical protein